MSNFSQEKDCAQSNLAARVELTTEPFKAGAYTDAQRGNLEKVAGVAPRWIGWREVRKPGEIKKYGVGLDGEYTGWNKNSGTLSEALELLRSGKGGRCGGVSLLANLMMQGFVCLDFDDVVVGGDLTALGCEIVRQFKSAYVELSPSGNGLRIVCRGLLPEGVASVKKSVSQVEPDTKAASFEAYTSKLAKARHKRMTGAALKDTGGGVQADCQDGVNWFCRTVGVGAAREVPGQMDSDATTDDIFEQLLKVRDAVEPEKILEALHQTAGLMPRGKLAAALRGDIKYFKGDHSSLDLYLCCEIIRSGADSVGDVIEVWGSTGAGARDKFKRRDYQNSTVRGAGLRVLKDRKASPDKGSALAMGGNAGNSAVNDAKSAGEPIIFTKAGKVAATRENAILILRHSALRGLFWFDDFKSCVQRSAGAAVLDSGADDDSGPLTDDDLTRVGLYLSREYGMHGMQKGDLLQAVQAAAKDIGVRRNPVRDRFEALGKQWDGVKRLDDWLIRWCKPAPDQGKEYLSLVGRFTLLQAVARVFSPGCKADTMLILCGAGGGRKSSLFRTLADGVGPDLFSDTAFELSDPAKLVEQTAGFLFVELAELSSMRRAKDVEAVKSALSG